MRRRTAIRDMIIFAGGATLLPSCLTRSEKVSIPLKKLKITVAQEKLLAEIASTIIPQTDTPGAKEVGAHLFALKMLDDCYEKTDQEKFLIGLAQLDDNAAKRFGDSFLDCNGKQRQELLESIEQNKDVSELAHFYEIMKDRTIEGYMNSKYVMTNLVIYELIPSMPYNGYAPA